MKGHASCVDLLISKGAKLNVTDRQYGTPLHAACVAYKINIDCIVSLIQAGLTELLHFLSTISNIFHCQVPM